MTTASTRITDIPLTQLVASDANVRRNGRLAHVEQLAASIAAHGLLQNLTVRPAATGKPNRFEVIAGGRRLAALKLLAKRKALAKDAPIPCHIAEGGIAEEISLAENALQCPMHPADQYEAFAALVADHAMPVEDIAARFGVTPTVVRQRLKLGAVSPVLRAAYRDGAMNLEQLSAFTITDDHAAQERVWTKLLPYDKSRALILRALNQGNVEVSDRRVALVGLDAYRAAGGGILTDLFDEDGGFVTDPAVLDQLVTEKLQAEADRVKAEGWAWVTVMPEFDYAATADMLRVYPQPVTLTDDEQERLDALANEYDALAEREEEADAARLEHLDAEITALTPRETFAPEDVARAGVFVSINYDGGLRVERGYVRRDDQADRRGAAGSAGGAVQDRSGPPPLTEALIADLTTSRTAALQDAMSEQPDVALVALTHALALDAFTYAAATDRCLKIGDRNGGHASLAAQRDPATAAFAARHAAWAARLPDDPAAFWTAIAAMEHADRLALLAHCAALGLDAIQTGKGGNAEAARNADDLAAALALDMRRCWEPTVANYLGRVSKERILAAVQEGVSPEAAENLARLKKAEMASAAETRLAGRGWLPEVLRAGSGGQATA